MRSARVAALAAAATATVLLVVPPVFAADRDAQPPDHVPGVVTIVGVGPGGGSGEVQLTWEALANATGYRVLRSDTTDGEFEATAELDVTTGAATASADVVNVFSDQHSYIPPRGTFEGPDQSPQFSSVDVARAAGDTGAGAAELHGLIHARSDERPPRGWSVSDIDWYRSHAAKTMVVTDSDARLDGATTEQRFPMSGSGWARAAARQGACLRSRAGIARYRS